MKLPDNDVTRNYSFDYAKGVYAVIVKKSVIVTAVGKSDKIYDGTTNYKNYVDFIVDGVIDADKGKIGQPHYDDKATSAKDVGEYTLSVTLPTLEKTGNQTKLSHT